MSVRPRLYKRTITKSEYKGLVRPALPRCRALTRALSHSPSLDWACVALPFLRPRKAMLQRGHRGAKKKKKTQQNRANWPWTGQSRTSPYRWDELSDIEEKVPNVNGQCRRRRRRRARKVQSNRQERKKRGRSICGYSSCSATKTQIFFEP